MPNCTAAECKSSVQSEATGVDGNIESADTQLNFEEGDGGLPKNEEPSVPDVDMPTGVAS